MPLIEITEMIDARWLPSPDPMVRTAEVLADLAAGQTVELLTTDARSIHDVQSWCRDSGDELLDATSDGAVYHFVLCRR